MEQDRKSPLKQSLWGKFYQMLITWIVYFLFRPKVEWVDRSVKKQLKGKPAVFVFNHTHHFDGAFTGAVLGRYKPYVLVKKNWYEKKAVGTMIGWCRCFPIDLEGADASWYSTAEEIIHRNGSLIIFPEGGIAREGKSRNSSPERRWYALPPGRAWCLWRSTAAITWCSAGGRGCWSESPSRAAARRTCVIHSTQSS